MNVLFLTKYDVLSHGVAEVLRELAAALRPIGVNVSVYSSDPSADCGELPGGVPCAHGPLPPPGAWGLSSNEPALQQIQRFADEQGVELIHAHGIYRPGHAARLLKRRIGLPYVLTSHSDLMDHKRLRRWRVRRRYRAILREADAVTHLSGVMAEAAQRLLDVREKSTLIPNGLDRQWWGAVEPVDDGYVLAIGRLVEGKGFDVLVEAWGKLAERGVAPPLVIAGSGPMESSLRQRAAELGLEVVNAADPSEAAAIPCNGSPRVCFTGLVEGEAKRELFARARLVAFPTQLPESFGLVMIEALAAGKPVVASDREITREVLGESSGGTFVPADDPGQWADAIERLSGDPEARQQSAEAARHNAAWYDWSTLAQRYVSVYRSVLGQDGFHGEKRADAQHT